MPNYIFTKGSTRTRPKNISKDQFISASYGDTFKFSPQNNPIKIYHFSGSNAFKNNEYLFLRSLKNTINYYKANDDIFNYDLIINKPITLVAFSSAHLGSGIEKGSFQINYYLSGNLLAEASDYRQDGVIYSGSFQNTGSNTPIGFILYKEGYVILNHTGSISNTLVEFSSSYNGIFYDKPSWSNALSCYDDYLRTSYSYSTISDLATYTHFIYANKYEFNHSNNPTYIKSGSYSYETSSYGFKEGDKIEVRNVVKSIFNGEAKQDKETYISKIGLYDKNKKLIGIASLANPVRKTENREYIFKLKIDI